MSAGTPPSHPRVLAAFSLVVALVWLSVGVVALMSIGPFGGWVRGDSVPLAVLGGVLMLAVQSPVIVVVLIAGRRMLRASEEPQG